MESGSVQEQKNEERRAAPVPARGNRERYGNAQGTMEAVTQLRQQKAGEEPDRKVAAKALEIPRFHKQFDKAALDAIREETDRLFVGHGTFNKVLEAAQHMAEVSEALHDRGGKLVKHSPIPMVPDQVSTVSQATLVAARDELVKQVDTWLKPFSDDQRRLEAGLFETAANNPTRENKFRACDDLVRGAQGAVAEMSPYMRDLRVMEASLQPGDRAAVDKLRLADAQHLQRAYGRQGATGGTSDVTLIQAPDKTVAYAFKTVDGESDQMGMAKGSGAVREVLAARLCETIRKDVGLDFGWPAASFAELGNAKGVLIDGLKGKEIYSADSIQAKVDKMNASKLPQAEFEKQYNKAVDDSKALQKHLPASELQKLLVCNLMLGQYDIKWDNALIEKTGPADHQLVARPFDGGAAFPEKDLLMTLAKSAGQPGAPATGENLLAPVHVMGGERIPAASAKLGDVMKAQFIEISFEKLETTAREVFQEARAFGIHPDVVQAAETGFDRSMQSIEGMKKIFATTPQLTTGDFLKQYDAQVLLPLAGPREAWVQDKIREYDALQQENPKLLLPLQELRGTHGMRDEQIVADFMEPQQRGALKELKKMGADMERGIDGLAEWAGKSLPSSRPLDTTKSNLEARKAEFIEHNPQQTLFKSHAPQAPSIRRT